MKRFTLFLLALIFPFMLMASSHDLTTSKGTDQSVIATLTPQPAQENVLSITPIKATFTVPLDAKHIKKHDVKLKCLTCKKKKSIKGSVHYEVAENAVVFVPRDELVPGMYEVEFKSLKAAKDHKKSKIKEIKYRFIVILDGIPPVITLNGEASMTIHQNSTYTELGATAMDNRDGEVSVTLSGSVDTGTLGTYTITYSAMDEAGNRATATRTVTVIDITPPVITLNGDATMTIDEGESYVEPGATAVDDNDGSVAVTISGTVDSSVLGSYTITYSAVDSAGNRATVIRTVDVIDVTPPVITLSGQNPIMLFVGQSYVEPGATAVDKRDGEVSVELDGTVDTATEGNYTITYSAIDTAGNPTEATRTVQVLIPQLVNLSLESNVTTLQVGEQASLQLTGRYEDNSSKQLTSDIEWSMNPTDSVQISAMVLTAVGSADTTLQAKVGGITSNAIGLTILEKPSITIPVPGSDDNVTIKYDHITLTVEATQTQTLTAINQTLSHDHNRTIRITGVDNSGTFYLYNIPLTQGANEINITATSKDNLSVSQLITLSSDANGSAPIGMRAGTYTGVGLLETTVEVGTLLKTQEYLFDREGDGIIDMTYSGSDGNFTVHFTDEGRYKPRVTIRTEDGLLYSSGDYALSLDVKADEGQRDPVGAQPVDVAKEFVRALIEDDREKVEHLVGYSQNLLEFIYGNNVALERAKRLILTIDPNSWTQTYRSNGSIEVRAEAYDSQIGKFPIVFEVMHAYGDDAGGGRMLYVSDLH